MYFVITIGSTYPSVYWTLIDPFDTLLTIRLGLAIPACGVEIWLVDCRLTQSRVRVPVRVPHNLYHLSGDTVQSDKTGRGIISDYTLLLGMHH